MARIEGGQICIEGARQLRATMRKAGADMKALSALNRSAAAIVLPVAKASTPVGPPNRGHLQATVRIGATQRAGIIRVGNKARPYAGQVHYGTPDGAVKPNPWVIDAAKRTEPQWTAAYWDGLMHILDQIQGDTP